MIVTIKPHAEMRMKDRGVAETQVREVLRNPKAVISVRTDLSKKPHIPLGVG